MSCACAADSAESGSIQYFKLLSCPVLCLLCSFPAVIKALCLLLRHAEADVLHFHDQGSISSCCPVLSCACFAACLQLQGLMQEKVCMSCACAADSAESGLKQYFKLLSCPVLALQLACSHKGTVTAAQTCRSRCPAF